MLEIYQNLSQYVSPIAFSIGFFDIRWYSLMYIIAFTVVYFLLKYRTKKNNNLFEKLLLLDLIIYVGIGILIGGRLGYVMFYDLQYFLHNLLEIFLPFQIVDGEVVFSGISGMSYHGGLGGAILAGVIFARKYKINFWRLINFVMPAVPAGYFFGRIGNFLNGELYGRATEKWWGMYFGTEKFLRHPSQLYEAIFEGIFLFIILWSLRDNKKINQNRMMLPIYLIGYGAIRFCLEFWREPDMQLGFVFDNFTMGQLLSMMMVIIGIGAIISRYLLVLDER